MTITGRKALELNSLGRSRRLGPRKKPPKNKASAVGVSKKLDWYRIFNIPCSAQKGRIIMIGDEFVLSYINTRD